MAKARIQHHDTVTDIEISDVALVVSVLGVTAAAVTAVYFVTRDPRTLKQLNRLAERRHARLVHHGVPLLGGAG
jgi:hypothetical protein